MPQTKTQKMKSEYYEPTDTAKNILRQWIEEPISEPFPDPVCVANNAALLALFAGMHKIITLAESISDEGSDLSVSSIKKEIESFISSFSKTV
jgi:hypothetical protein